MGWLPLGGYVKIAGMIDESMDKEALSKPAQPWEFRSKPAWQRLIIMIGGVVMNVLVAFVIYAFILMIWGDKKIPTSSMKYGVHVVDSTLYKMGIRNGDRIISIDNQPVNDFEKLRRKLILGEQVQLQRGEELITINLDKDLIGQLVENRNKDRRGFLEARRPAIAFFVPDTGNAFKAGLRPGDKMLAINNNSFEFYDQLQEQLPAYKGDTINLLVERAGQAVELKMPISEEGKIGFLPYGYNYQQMDSLGWIKLEVNRLSFFAAIPGGIKKRVLSYKTTSISSKRFLILIRELTKGLVVLKQWAPSFPDLFGIGKPFGELLPFSPSCWRS